MGKNKRLKIILSTAVLTGSLVYLHLFPPSPRLEWVFLPAFLALLFAFLVFGLPAGIDTITFSLFPFSLTLGFALAQYFYPNFHLFFKILLWGGFGLSFYLLLLTLNVFRVERVRGGPIPLEKAAKPVVFVFAFLTTFVALTALYKLDLGVPLAQLFIFLLSFSLSLNALWFLECPNLFTPKLFVGALIVAVLSLEISLAFSFFPWKAHFRGLSEAVFYYSGLGVSRAYFERHISGFVALEYLLVTLAVFIFSRLIY